MDKQRLLERLDTVQQVSNLSKLQRMLRNPLRYVFAILYRDLLYKLFKSDYEVNCSTFYSSDFRILLPSSIDIYLTKGKSHHSEIHLAKFLIHQLNEGDTFIDIGAHFGYFSLLASTLVGKKGQVHSFEPTSMVFEILNKNTKKHSNITANNKAAGETNGEIAFYEFPTLYSEYNSINQKQYELEKWFEKHKAKKVNMPMVALDSYVSDTIKPPKIIKIDVEGAELSVLRGASNLLSTNSPILILEFLTDSKNLEVYREANLFLKNLGYKHHRITDQGELDLLDDIESYMNKNGIDSDNIVFKK